MRTEIERKFLVAGDGWRPDARDSRALRDGLLCVGARGKIRVLLDDSAAWLTIKGPRVGLSRSEYEFVIPRADAEALLAGHCLGRPIEKTLHRVPHDGLTWEVDVYGGPLSGLVLAEVELTREDQSFARPPWLGAEVSGDPRYRQTALIERVRQSSAADRPHAATMNG